MERAANSPWIAEWPYRPWVLAALLGLAGLLIHLLAGDAQDSGIRMALAALVGIAGLALAFTLDPDRWRAPAIFAIIVGLVMGGLVWRAVGMADDLAAEEYGIMAGIFAAGLSLPLFQAGFHRLRWRTSYADTHFHVWTDAISAGGALAFTGLSWLVLLLVGALLDLVGIPLNELYDEGWFGWTFSGAAFGAGLGVLRNQLKIIGTLQSLVLTVFSLLAVPVALAVTVFLAAVLVSGPSVLWDATDSSTPILLAIAAGSFVLVNSVIRDDAESMSGNPVLRIAARVLALGILPLTVFAAISMGARIEQHGLTPERLWGLAAIVVAVAFGLAYSIDLVRGWKGGWPERLRASNLKLAVGTAVYALLLALPILNFGGISTANQVARLESGTISVEEFDFSALRWDFGEAGREALARLARSDDKAIAEAARQAQREETRPYRPTTELDGEGSVQIEWLGGDLAQREAIGAYIEANRSVCYRPPCHVIVTEIRLENEFGTHVVVGSSAGIVTHLGLADDGVLTQLRIADGRFFSSNDWRSNSKSIDQGSELEVRPYSGRQLYVDGKPVGEPFE